MLAKQAGTQKKVSVGDALLEFRDKFGFNEGLDAFLRWFRADYPAEYAAVF